MRVLLVEDDDDLRVLTAEGLVSRGCAVDAVRSCGEARDALRAARYDVLLVDRGLPDGDGITLPRVSKTPVIFTTALGTVQDRIDGLNAGGDDYVVKPFDLDELAARIEAVCRKPGPRREPLLTFGPLQFDPGHREATLSGERLELGRRETALLALLLADAPRTVIKDRIEDGLYSFNEAVTPNAVEALVSRLRRRLEPGGLTIKVARGIGWRLDHA